MRNGCGGKGGFKFSRIRDTLKKLPFVNPKKLDSLYYDIETKCCDPHDDRFTQGGGIKSYLYANYEFINNLLGLLQWTTISGRILVVLVVYIPMNILGLRYFNWTKVW